MHQKLRNRAARIVTNSSYDAPAVNLIKELKWPTVQEMIKQETATVVFKSINRLGPTYHRVLSDPYSDVLCSEECQATKLLVCCKMFAFFKAMFLLNFVYFMLILILLIIFFIIYFNKVLW